MRIKNSDAFLDELISALQNMKADPEKDTAARVLAMVFRVANKHNDRIALKKAEADRLCFFFFAVYCTSRRFSGIMPQKELIP